MDKIDEVILVGGSTRMPAVAELAASCRARNRTRVSTPTRLSLYARSRAGVLKGEVKDVLLLDVTLRSSLGIETKGGVMTKIIERNTTIPTKRSGDLHDGRGQSAVGDGAGVPG